MGKTWGPLKRKTLIDWLAKAGNLTSVSKKDLATLIRECMSAEEFSSLQGELHVGNVVEKLDLFKGLYQFYFPNMNLIGKFYANKQHNGEIPKCYEQRKKIVALMEGATTLKCWSSETD